MSKKIISLSFVVFYLSVVQVHSLISKKDFGDFDVFKVLDLDTNNLARRSTVHRALKGYTRSLPTYEKQNEIEKLNDRLMNQIESDDPHKNLDFIINELILDMKNDVSFDSKSVQAKRLLASLSLIDGENECNYFGFKILSKNFEVIKPNLELVKNNDLNSRRVDKIVANYINEHNKNCKQIYLTKFESITSSSKDDLLERLSLLFRKSIESIKSKASDSFDYTRSLYKATHGTHKALYLRPVDIREALIEMMKKDGKTPSDSKKEEFMGLYDEYISKPCEYFRDQFGPDVFEPFLFDRQFDRQIQGDEVDFYEALFKYQMCYGLFKDERAEVERLMSK